MNGRPDFGPAIMCILTFCIATVVVVDAVMPFGYIVVQVLKESDLPIAMRVLFLAPIFGLLVSAVVNHTVMRSVLTVTCALALFGLWVLGLIRFVAYPIWPTESPGIAKILFAVTSIPFLIAVMVTVMRSIRSTLSVHGPQQVVRPEL